MPKKKRLKTYKQVLLAYADGLVLENFYDFTWGEPPGCDFLDPPSREDFEDGVPWCSYPPEEHVPKNSEGYSFII